MIPILILAAGTSRRMRGRDKLLETIDTVPLIHRTANRALATGHPVYVTLPPQPHPRYDALEGLDVTCIPVPDAELGMSESMKAGIAGLPKEAEAVLVVLADMPELDTHHFLDMVDARTEAPDALVWRGVDENGTPGHPVLFDASLFPLFDNLSGDNGAQQIVSHAKLRVHLVKGLGRAARVDLDTPEAWDAWRKDQRK